MTPEEARDLLDGTTPAEDWWYSVKGGWVRHLEPVGIDAAGELDVSEDDAALIVAAPTLAAMVAGMREEWGITYTGVNYDGRHTEWGYESRDEAERQARRYRLCTDMHPVRLVRRYVTTEEEA